MHLDAEFSGFLNPNVDGVLLVSDSDREAEDGQGPQEDHRETSEGTGRRSRQGQGQIHRRDHHSHGDLLDVFLK